MTSNLRLSCLSLPNISELTVLVIVPINGITHHDLKTTWDALWCWHLPLIAVLRRKQQGGSLWVWGQPDPQTKFQDSQGYTEKPCFKKTKNTWGAKVYFSLQFYRTLHHWRQSGQQFKQGQGWDMEIRDADRSVLLTGLLTQSFLGLLSYTCPGRDHKEWATHTNNQSWKCPTELPTSQVVGCTLSIKIPPSQRTVVCIELTRTGGNMPNLNYSLHAFPITPHRMRHLTVDISSIFLITC